MTAGTVTPYRPGRHAGRDGFAQLLHAEWTKFRTVRGWVIGMTVAVLLTAGIGLLAAGGTGSSCQSTSGSSGGPTRSGSACGTNTFPVGPGGVPVDDSFYFVRQPLTGNGSITVQVTSLTGLLPPANPNVQVGPTGRADPVATATISSMSKREPARRAA